MYASISKQKKFRNGKENKRFHHRKPLPFVYWIIPVLEGGGFLLSEETKRNLALAAACTGGMAVLLAPASVITLALGVALGYKGQNYIKEALKGGNGT